METNTKIVAAGIGASALLALTAFGLGAWYLVTHPPINTSGSLTGAFDDADYEPTSEWIEEGLNPDVTTFGFGDGPAAEPTGPELSEGQIQNLVIRKQNDLMDCYAAALQTDDELQGKVVFQFGIAPDGHVAMVRVTGSTLASKPTEDCMVARARQWSFPATNRAALMKFDTDFTFVYE